MKTKITIIFSVIFIWGSQSQNLQVFDTFDEFQIAVTNECSTINLTLESFDGILQHGCGVTVLPDPNQMCFATNELESGFTIQGLSQENMGAKGIGSLGGSPINLVFPNNAEDTTIIDFNPNVSAVSFSTWQITNEPANFEINVYGEELELLGTFIKDSPTMGLYSFHVISDEPITRIDTKGSVVFGAGVLIGNLYFGASNCVTQISIPDSNFEQHLVNLGYDDTIDGAVDVNNINAVTSLDVSSLNISDLKGLEAFSALETFNCINNPLTTIDLSNNINTVSVSNNSELTSLILEIGTSSSGELSSNNNSFNTNSSNITSLDATNNTSLQCIQVNSVTDAQNNPNWFKDASADYSTNCQSTLNTNSFNDISNLISIYPNPSKDYVNIDFSGNLKSIEILNILGERVLEKKQPNNYIDINTFESGIYFVKFETNLGQAVKKLIKE